MFHTVVLRKSVPGIFKSNLVAIQQVCKLRSEAFINSKKSVGCQAAPPSALYGDFIL